MLAISLRRRFVVMPVEAVGRTASWKDIVIAHILGGLTCGQSAVVIRD
jgi:hypothetical protein